MSEQLCDKLSVKLLYIGKQIRDITIFMILILADNYHLIIINLNFIDPLSSLLHQTI